MAGEGTLMSMESSGMMWGAWLFVCWTTVGQVNLVLAQAEITELCS